jgi:hypothetical protein
MKHRKEKNLFLFVLTIGLVLHSLGIVVMQKIPIGSGGFAINKLKCNSPLKISGAQEWVVESIDTSTLADSPEIKEELQELRPEFAPTASIAFSKTEKLKLDEMPTAFAPKTFESKLELSENEMGDLHMHETISLPGPKGTCFYEEGKAEELPFADIHDLNKNERGLIAESDHFSVTCEFSPRRFFPGYIFKITLLPKQEIPFKRIRENYFFLLDRSNSILRGRYFYNKKAVSDCLAFLKPGDTFNILIFDDKVVRLSQKPIAWTQENITLARSFLSREGHGGHFAATDIYASLDKIIPLDVPDNEINTAILLSDGDTYLPIEKQRQLIGGWSERNCGKVSLFCLASGTGNNLALLEILSQFNKGALLYEAKHDQVGEKLKQLITSVQSPIGKQITATAIPSEKEMSIYLQPKEQRLPHLYKHSPYVLFGCTNRLSDFTVFLQGKYYERRFDIKKKILFSEAKRGPVSLEREWTELVVQDYYERFFQDGKISHLDSAKQLLAPLNLTVPFLNQ